MKRCFKLIALMLVVLSFNLIVPVVKAAGALGDVNADGKITSDDARLALRYTSRMQKLTSAQKSAADMNKDSSVTLEDVNLIMADAIDLETYEEKLLRQGFPKSYVEYLAELHKKYPEWEFVPMITGLDWQKSIDGERDPHRKQLIESVVQSSFKCSCSSCSGVIQEGPNWVSASEEAVKYYMDPRNFLTEEYIFQFESTSYGDGGYTIEGIEAILENTWMYKSEIKYLNALGETKTFTLDGEAPTYSEVILKAAKDSGMSPYYLASKMVQEVGSTSSSNAGGSSGKNSPYNGIYNYYNIGAYTGASDGLEWANGFMKTATSTKMYKKASASSTQVVTIPSNTELNYISASGSYYRVKARVNGTTWSGYVKKSDTSVYTSYGRPWTNPYKTIYYGAQYIYDSFGDTQFTGYLQKFNVNPDSETLYGHEYMANVRAAAFESKNTYNAYVSAGIIENKKVFSIPVFKNLPGADYTKEDYFKESKPTVTVPEYTASSVTLSWTSLDNAQKYQVYKYNKSSEDYEKIKTTSNTTYTDTSLSEGDFPRYKVRAYYVNADEEYVFSSFSSVFYATVTPNTPKGLEVASKSESSVKLKWNDAGSTGYLIYRYDSVSGSYERIGSTRTTSYTDSTVDSGTTYKYKIKAYTETNSRTFYSAGYSSVISVTTKGEATAKNGYVSITEGSLNIRKSASTSGDILVQVSNGYPVTILGSSGDWYKVSLAFNGEAITGYAHKDYIKIGTYSDPTPEEPDKPEKEECPYTEPDVTLRQGDSGEGVRWLQWYLYKLDYLKEGDVDGSFGPTTLSAVMEFQTDEKLDVDGLVGSGTRGALKEAYGA